MLFTLYTSDVISVIQRHNFNAHAYADDLQSFGHCSMSDMNDLEVRMSECIRDVNQWMSSNRLCLNPFKTEMIWVGSGRRLTSLIENRTVRVGNTDIIVSNSVRDHYQ